MIVEFTKSFLETGLVVPPGKQREEFCDSVQRGLVIQIAAMFKSDPCYVWRYKTLDTKKTTYRPLGSIKEITIPQARKQVAQWKAEHSIAAKLAPEQKPAVGEMTLDTFWTEHYLPHAKIHKRSWVRDEQLYRIRIKPRFSHCKLSEITRYSVQQFQNDLSKEKLSPASQDHHIRLAARLLSLATQWDFLERNVLKGIPLRKVENGVENYLNETQLKQLVEVLKVDTCHTPAMALLFLISSGARVTEALTATWKNIDVEAGVWKVDAIRAKGKRSRNIPLNDSAKWVLEQLESKGSSDYLFPSPVKNGDGRETHYKRISRGFWSRIKKLAGIPANVRVHDLRHSYLSLLARKGASQSYLQVIAGHSDYRMTKRYIHLTQSAINEIANLASVIVPKVTPNAAPEAKEVEAIPAETATAEILQFPKAA